jgi:hypothetical protein
MLVSSVKLFQPYDSQVGPIMDPLYLCDIPLVISEIDLRSERVILPRAR